MSHSFYRDSVNRFLTTDPSEIHSLLERRHAAEFKKGWSDATWAWTEIIAPLQSQLAALNELTRREMTIILEYAIPRLRSRIDCVLFAKDRVFVLEFKSGEGADVAEAKRQALKYRQELVDFHSGSRNCPIIPFAVGPGFVQFVATADWQSTDAAPVLTCPMNLLAQTVETALTLPVEIEALPVSPASWDDSVYFPVPAIVDAMTELFAKQDIREIASSKAGPQELSRATKVIMESVSYAKQGHKVLCVLTGVPGAGKTLVGLSTVAEIQKQSGDDTRAVFLSGNGPLVRVLREALYRWMTKSSWKTSSGRKGTRANAEAFIQEMHMYISSALKTNNPQAESILIFDEAQRAWSKERNTQKAKTNKSLDLELKSRFQNSEPELVLQVMDRLDWCLVVALVGGGQEIHEGEAGLSAWGEAIAAHPHWELVTSPEAILGGPSVAGTKLFPADIPRTVNCRTDNRLHLSVAKRSIESDSHAQWTNHLLSGDLHAARTSVQHKRPIMITRDLNRMRSWLRKNGQHHYRIGLAASKGATRLRAYGIEPPTYDFMGGIDYTRWFLDPPTDVRSSYQLEVAMSEFELQGLELDYVGLCWGGDLVWEVDHWVARHFGASKWEVDGDVRDGTAGSKSTLTLNKYRVLLTRFRKGMVIFVPPGSEDPTDPRQTMDEVYEALTQAGCQSLPC